MKESDKDRRARENKLLKKYLKYGTLIWDSTKGGTYIRKKHGEIGTKQNK